MLTITTRCLRTSFCSIQRDCQYNGVSKSIVLWISSNFCTAHHKLSLFALPCSNECAGNAECSGELSTKIPVNCDYIRRVRYFWHVFDSVLYALDASFRAQRGLGLEDVDPTITIPDPYNGGCCATPEVRPSMPRKEP